jgi:hypothetical protein
MMIVAPPVNSVPDVLSDNYRREDIREAILSLLTIPDLDDLSRHWLHFELDHGGYINRLKEWLHRIL